MTDLPAPKTGSDYMDAMIVAARTLDAASALAATPLRTIPKNDNGAVVSNETWALSGLHTIRASTRWAQFFTADEITASKTWLVANGWQLPA